MKQQGRQGGKGPPPLKPRPEPPEHIADEAKAEWQRVVDALPADWFGPETWALLEAYCNSVAQMRWLDAAAVKLQRESVLHGLDVTLYSYYRKQSSAEAVLMANLATKLRITLQASTTKDKGKGSGAAGPKPWEDADGKA